MRFIRSAIVLTAMLVLFGGHQAFAQATTPPATWSVSDCQRCHGKAMGTVFAHTKHAQVDLSCANCHQNVGEHAKAQMAGETNGPMRMAAVPDGRQAPGNHVS